MSRDVLALQSDSHARGAGVGRNQTVELGCRRQAASRPIPIEIRSVPFLAAKVGKRPVVAMSIFPVSPGILKEKDQCDD